MGSVEVYQAEGGIKKGRLTLCVFFFFLVCACTCVIV